MVFGVNSPSNGFFNPLFIPSLSETLCSKYDLLLLSGRKGPLPEHLSIEEELLVRRFYENKIQQVCAAFRLPNKIQVWALIRTGLKEFVIIARTEESV